MKVVAYMAQSLDGFIAGVNGELDWLDAIDNPEGSDMGFADFINSIDALLMGRNTFEVVSSFDDWPYAKHVYVASNSLTSIPAEYADKASLVSGSLSEMYKKIADDGMQTIYIDGGMLIQSALQHQSLDEITITTVPIILGAGIPLFTKVEESKVKLSLLSSEVLLGQLVKNHYKIVAS